MGSERPIKGKLQSRVRKSKKNKPLQFDALLQGFYNLKVEDNHVQGGDGVQIKAEPDEEYFLNRSNSRMIETQILNGEATAYIASRGHWRLDKRTRHRLKREEADLATKAKGPTQHIKHDSSRTFMDDWLNGETRSSKEALSTHTKIKEEPSENKQTPFDLFPVPVKAPNHHETSKTRRKLKRKTERQVDSLLVAFGDVSIGNERPLRMGSERKPRKKATGKAKKVSKNKPDKNNSHKNNFREKEVRILTSEEREGLRRSRRSRRRRSLSADLSQA